MLKEIEIQNFRCFEHIKISGFERINLIGGKNNAGKTALLEALFLKFVPRPSSILLLRELRKESSLAMKAMPDKAWDNLFYAITLKSQEIVIFGKNDDNSTSKIELSINNIDEIMKTKNSEKIMNDLVWDSGVTVISINSILTAPNGHEYCKSSSLVASSRGLLIANDISNENDIYTNEEVPIIPSFTKISGIELTEAYDRARLDDKDSEVLKAFQVIDPAIESVESFSIGEPTLYLRRKGEKRLPLSLFGDAMNRVADIILKLVNSEHKILLIDEIENGIHYTNQRNFWRVLFRLAVELDTQIFATTHSLEMLQAFADVGLEPDQECSSAYFELAKKPKTNQIIGIRRDLETLNYALEHQKGVRGE